MIAEHDQNLTHPRLGERGGQLPFTGLQRTACRAVSEALPAIAMMCVLGLGGCGQRQETFRPAKEFEIDKEVKRGPIAFSIRIDRKEISIADRLRLNLQVRAKEGYEVELPGFGDKLEQFAIVDYRSPPSRLVGEGEVLTERTYDLEPFLSGEYKIPPMKVVFWRKADKDPKKHEIESEEVAVKVTSLLPEQLAKLEIRDIAPPVEMPPPDRKGLYAGLGCGALGVLLLAGLLVWRAKRRRVVRASWRPPHEAAFRAIERLVAEKLIEKGETKLFYLRLSGILRHYIGDRFGLHAPEHTTEEFLDEMSHTAVLGAAHQGRLREFLTHCDLVKFAEYPPTTGEIQRTFDICKQFILETVRKEAEDVTTAA